MVISLTAKCVEPDCLYNICNCLDIDKTEATEDAVLFSFTRQVAFLLYSLKREESRLL